MRKFILSLLLLCFTGLAFGQIIPELLYYKFDGTGNTVPNLALTPPVGTANATILGGVTQGTGICDGSLIGSGLSATTDYLNTNWTPNLANGSWTIAFKTSGISTNTTLYYIFGEVGTGGFRCFTNGVAGSTNWILRGAGLADVYINGGALMTPTSMAYVYDASLNQVRAYLNGVLVSTVAQGAVNLTGTGALKVMGYSSSVGAPAGGQMDEFMFFNRALNGQEVADLVAPVITGFLGADQELCANDSILLQTPGPSQSVLWSTGETTNAISVNTPGTYSVGFSGTCSSGADTITILNAPALPGPGFAGPDGTICTGDSFLVNLPTTGSPIWSTGDTTSSVVFNMPGIYTVDVTEQCGVVSDTVEVFASALVYTGFAVADSGTACDGDTVNLSTTSAFDSYLWFNGDSTATTMVTTSGIYTVSVMDACGAGTDSVAVNFIAGVSAAFTSSVNMMTVTMSNGSTGGGNVTYAWSFGDGNTSTAMSPTHTYASNGTYLVTLTVTNECGTSTATDSVVINFVGVAQTINLGLNVYPNPAKDQVVVAAELGEAIDLRISLISLIGQVQYSQEIQAAQGSLRQNIDVSSLAAGLYFVKVESEKGQQVTRLVVE